MNKPSEIAKLVHTVQHLQGRTEANGMFMAWVCRSLIRRADLRYDIPRIITSMRAAERTGFPGMS